MKGLNTKGQFIPGLMFAGVGIVVLLMLSLTVIPWYNDFFDAHIGALEGMQNFYIFGALLAAIPIVLVIAGMIKIYESFVRPGQG